MKETIVRMYPKPVTYPRNEPRRITKTTKTAMRARVLFLLDSLREWKVWGMI